MSKGAKGGGGSGKGGSLFAGVVLGMVMGLAVAGGVAWYILKKNPSSFEDKEHHEAAKPEVKSEPAAAPAPAAVNPPVAASAVGETKQHFEFYKVLTDKPETTTQAQKSPEKAAPAAKPAQPAAASRESYFVQAGSFPNQDDAEKLKAKLALLGMEASVQSADIPGKGTYHRVRLGPVKGGDDLSRVMALLKQNGVANATTFKVQ